MEIFLFYIIFPLLLIGVPAFFTVRHVYNQDRVGWNATFKRLSRVSRANLEAAKGVPAIEPAKKIEDKSAAEWEAEFSGKPMKTPETQLKHAIVKTDYKYTSLGTYWPRWYCKCGANAAMPDIGDMKRAERDALKQGHDHVRAMNDAEEKMRNSNGNFAF